MIEWAGRFFFLPCFSMIGVTEVIFAMAFSISTYMGLQARGNVADARDHSVGHGDGLATVERREGGTQQLAVDR
jgi:hypothetical protein